MMQLDNFFSQVRQDFRLILTLGFGVFLFVLFFQPFTLNHFDFNNHLLLISGLAAIVVLSIILSRNTLFLGLHNNKQFLSNPFGYLLEGVSLTALSTLGFVFYLLYVGDIAITFYIVFKIVLINSAVTVILKINDAFLWLKAKNKELEKDIELISSKSPDVNEEEPFLQLHSDTYNGDLRLKPSEIAYFESADNYVEVVYYDQQEVKRKLIRNTMKNIEILLSAHPRFIRCHRSYIVNLHRVKELNKNHTSNWLSLKEAEVKIPVSRQYLIKLKESLQ